MTQVRRAAWLGLGTLLAAAGCDYARTSYSRAPAKPSPAHVASGPTPTSRGGVSLSCTTSCIADGSSDVAPDDRARAAVAMEPTFKDLRVCLDRMGRQEINPAALLRSEGPGPPTSLRYDVGGYEELGCVQEIRKRGVEVTFTRAGSIRCVYRCE